MLHRREDPARCAIRRENLHGMRFKSEYSGASTSSRGIDHEAVPQMNPIEYPKSQTEIRFSGFEFCETMINLHEKNEGSIPPNYKPSDFDVSFEDKAGHQGPHLQ